MWAIHEACSRFISGEVKSVTKGFAPKPDQLCTVVREIVDAAMAAEQAAPQAPAPREVAAGAGEAAS